MTSFDYAYKLEAVRDWLFAQTKLSVPLLALLLSFFGLIFVFLIYPENAPPVKSGALYQNTVPLPHLKHRLIQCVNLVFRFLCPESLAAQHLQIHIIAVCFTDLKKRGFESLNRWEGDAVRDDKSFGYRGFVW